MNTYHKIKGKRGKGHRLEEVESETGLFHAVCNSFEEFQYYDELTPTTTNLCKRCQNWEKRNGEDI